MSDRYVECPDHGIQVLLVSQAEADERGIEMGCPAHNEEMRARPPVESMTVYERVVELRATAGPLYSSLDLLFRRQDALVGRPLLTHERIDFDLLEHEMRTGLVPSLEGVIAKLPADMPVIIASRP